MSFRMRGVFGAALVAASVGLAGCDSFLTVENPGAITDDQLNDAALAETLANAALGEIQRLYSGGNDDDGQALTYWSAIMTDEAVAGHNFIQWREIDLRQMRDNNDLGQYAEIHQARWFTDTTAVRLSTLIGDADLRTARTYALAGWAYVFAGEFLCESPLNVSAQIYTSNEISAMAIPRFEKAIEVAEAARAAGGDDDDVDLIVNLARVGAARSSLNTGSTAQAISYAQSVPADFEYIMAYSDNSNTEANVFFSATTGANHTLGVDVTFRDLNDPRVMHHAESRRGHNNSTDLWTPYQSPVFTDWTQDGDTIGFAEDTDMRFTSGLEARHILAEAEGATPATLAFVNERRAVGNQLPVVLAGDALMAELRDQKRRDFFLGGTRMGDLRRWAAQGIDLFPTGTHPNAEWDDEYGTSTCIPINLDEKIGNPNLGG